MVSAELTIYEQASLNLTRFSSLLSRLHVRKLDGGSLGVDLCLRPQQIPSEAWVIYALKLNTVEQHLKEASLGRFDQTKLKTTSLIFRIAMTMTMTMTTSYFSSLSLSFGHLCNNYL